MKKKKSASKKPSAGNTRKKKAAKKSAAKKSAAVKQKKTAPAKEFTEVFAALRKILTPYEGRLAPRQRDPGYFYMESLEPTYKDRPMFFAGVKAEKNYITYHLLPVYTNPELNQQISPALKKRMQGKACFNFAAIDAPLFKELGVLTKSGYKVFKDRGWL